MDAVSTPHTHPRPRAVHGPNHIQAIPLTSPASASSSTLITTPLPIGRSKESLRLSSSAFHEDPVPDPVASPGDRPQRAPQTRHVVLAGTRTGNGTALPPTRMSASGFVEPHHSNVPRRVRVRGQTKTKTGKKMGDRGADNREDDSESDGGNGGSRRVRELRRSVKEALTPGRRWSDSEDEDTKEHGKDGDKNEEFALEYEVASRTVVQNDDEDTTMLRASLTASQSLYATHGGPTPTSSRNLNTERTPLHLLSLKLPPSPTDGVGPVLESAPAAMEVVQDAPLQIPPRLPYQDLHDGLPQTAPVASSGAFALTRASGMGPPQTPLVSQGPHISTSSLRPATLPRRRKPGPPGAGTPTPKSKPLPAPGTTADAVDHDEKKPVPVPGPGPAVADASSSSMPHIPTQPRPPGDDTMALGAPTPGQSKTRGTGTVGVRFHGHHSASASSSSSSAGVAEGSSKGSVRKRQKGAAVVQGGPMVDVDSGDARRPAAAAGVPGELGRERRLGRRNTVGAGAKGKGSVRGTEDGDMRVANATGTRSQSCATPRTRARSVQRVVDMDLGAGPGSEGGRASPSKSCGGADAECDDAVRLRIQRTAARERRRAEREQRGEPRRARRERRREREERMCVQRLGARARVEVAFFLDNSGTGGGLGADGEGEGGEEDETQRAYVLLEVVEPESDSEDEDGDEDEWDSDWELQDDTQDLKGEEKTPARATTSTQGSSSSLVLPPTPAPMCTPGQQAPTDTTHAAKGSMRQELKLYLPTDLSTHMDGVPALSAAQVREGCEFIHTALSSPGVLTPLESSVSRLCRVRVTAPRGRPEDAWAIALCYQAGVDSSESLENVMTTKTTADADSPLTSTPLCSSAGAARLSATAKDAGRRSSVSVPVPPLALVRGEDGEVEGVVEVVLDIEALDEQGGSPQVDVDITGISNDDGASSSATLPSMTAPSQSCTTDAQTETEINMDTDETYMLLPTYTYPVVYRLAMRLLDEGAGEWHTRGRQWEERVERMHYSAAAGAVAAVGTVASAGVGVVRASGAGAALRHMQQERDSEDEVEDSQDDGEDEDWEGKGETDESDAESEEESFSGDEEAFVDIQSAGARQGSESTGELDANADDTDFERGRTHEPHTRTGPAHHGVPLPSKYEEPSSAFVSSAHGRSKSRARSKSKAAEGRSKSKSKSRARSMSIPASASASKMKRRNRLSVRCDPFLDDDDDHENGVDKATRKARRVELRRLRSVQRRVRKEEEEVAAYAGIRTEWRGVLSFDGLQKLVGVWAPAGVITSS